MSSVSVAHVTTIAESLKLLLLNQLRGIDAAGYAVTGLSAGGPTTEDLAAAGLRHIEVPFARSTRLTPGADLRALVHLVRLFRRERFTIVHTHTAKPDLYAALAARIAGVPIVVTTLHGFYFHDEMPAGKREMFARLAQIGMACCDAVLSQNPEDVATATRERICDPAKLELLGNGIDLARFDRSRVSDAANSRLRRELEIPDEALVIGFVGRLVEEKGVLELFEATKLIRSRFPNVRLLLVGWSDRAKHDAIDRATATRYGIDDICVFTGHRDDTPELFSLMDVFALPSHREGFPRTVMEAAAMGVPSVATNIRGCRTAVDDERSGVLVPVRDPSRLAEALGALLSDPARRRRMSDDARRLARERFDEKRVVEIVLSTYRRLLSARGLPVPSAR